MIAIYTLPTCPHCHSAKNFMNSYRIPYFEYDVSKDPGKVQEMFMKSGQYGTPVIDVDGYVIVGFNQAQLTEVLHQRGYLR